ncbi:hypothetical protein AAG906_004295 [Vitis piasezkii]
MMSRDNRHASSWLIGESIRETYQGVGCEFRPKDIVADIRKQYGIQISYDKAWRAKELTLVLDCDNQFKYFFMSIGASLAGFHTSIRPVVAVDGTFLKAKYLGTLFIAACKDGNNRIYPLAFGIGDSKMMLHGSGFTKLHDALGHIDDLFVISIDMVALRKRHKVFPNARHGVCTYHVGQNLKTKFKNPQFISCSMMLPMLIVIEKITSKWFVTRQQQAMSMSTELTMWADGELRSRYNMSRTYLVEPINSKECNVNYAGISAQVNLDTRSCTCRQFDLDHIPCAHAIACRFYNISCYTLCSKYFSTKALLSSYSIPNHIRDKVVLPPKTRRPTGRPRKVRIPSVER